jgi:hypothetical protein
MYVCMHGSTLINLFFLFLWSGPAREASNYFASLGKPCPHNVSAAEHCLDLVSVNFESKDTEISSRERVHMLADTFDRRNAARQPCRLQPYTPLSPHTQNQASLLEQIALLFARSWRQSVRNRLANSIRIAQQTAVAIVYGGIYTLTDSQSSIQVFCACFLCIYMCICMYVVREFDSDSINNCRGDCV